MRPVPEPFGMWRLRRVLVAATVMGATAWVSGTVTYASFTGTTNEDNYVDAGHVLISDDDEGVAMLTLMGARPDDSTSGCILVTYEGSIEASVRLYATVAGDLAEHVLLTVTRGGGLTEGATSCTGFTADTEDHIGAGAGILYDGTLADFPDTTGSAIVDPQPSWSPEEVHAYRFTATLTGDESSVQGLTANADFIWRAQSLLP